MPDTNPEIDIYPATAISSPEELREVLNSAIINPITREPVVEDIEEVIASVPRSEAELAEKYCAVARDKNTSQILGMMSLKNPDDVIRDFALTESPVEVTDAYALRVGTGVGSLLLSHLEEVARQRGHTEIVLVSGPRYMTRGWKFWTKLYGEPVGVAEKYFEDKYNGKVWRKELTSA